MTTFDKREQAFEKKFALDEELIFKANARRDWLLGLWAAEKLGLAGTDAEAYAKKLIVSEVDKPGSDYILDQICADFQTKGISQSSHQIRRVMEEFKARAVAELRAGI